MPESTIKTLLSTYPRKRPELSEAHRQIYVQEYQLNRGGQTLASRLSQKTEAWMHRIVASNGAPGSVLEIGAGNLNHLPYESVSAVYDIVEPFEALYANNPHRAHLRRIYSDMAEIPPDNRYQRILSVAVLEHLERLPEVIARAILLLDDNGLFQHAIPSEGGFLWGLGWRLTTGLAYRIRTGLEYGVLMRHEHINNAHEILSIVRSFFEDVKIKRFPLPFFHLSFYTYIEASKPRKNRARQYLTLDQV